MSTKQIGALSFQIGQLPGWDNFRAFHAFLKLVGPSVEPVLQMATKLALGAGKKPASVELQPILLNLIATLPQTLAQSNVEDVEAFARTMFRNVVVTSTEGGKSKAVPLLDVFDSMMTGPKLLTVMELLAACVQENFGGFFAEMLTRGGSLKAAAPLPKAEQPASESPTT